MAGMYYPHCHIVVVRAIVAHNRLKHMLTDNGSSINIFFGSIYDKMLVDQELTIMISQRYGFTGDSIILSRRFKLVIDVGISLQVAQHFMNFFV